MKTYFKKSVAITLLFIMLINLLPISISATKTGTPYLSAYPDSEFISSLSSVEIDYFNKPAVDWTGNQISAENSFDSSPYTPLEGSRSLLVGIDGESGFSEIKLTSEFSAKYIGIAVFCPDSISVRLTAGSKKFTYTDVISVSGGRWQYLIFDITDDSHITKGSVSGIPKISEITLSFVTEAEYAVIDCVSGFDKSPINEIMFYTESFEGSGVAFFFDNGISATMVGDGEHKLSFTPINNLFGSGVGLGVIIDSPSQSSLTLNWENEKDNGSISKKLNTGENDLVFELPECEIDKITLVFGGKDGEEYTLKHIGRMQAYTKPIYEGEITYCGVSTSGNGHTLSVKAGCSKEYDGKIAYLFSISADEESKTVAGRAAIAQGIISGGEVSFEASLSSDGSGLYRKYRVAVENEGNLMVIGDDSFISNISDLSKYKNIYLQSSVKGSGNGSTDSRHLLSAVSEKIDLLSLITTEEGIVQTSGGASCAIDEKYASSLDKKMKYYASLDVAVYFILTAEKTGDSEKDGLVFDSDGLIRLDSPERLAIRAALNWLIKRYSTQAGMTDNLVAIVPSFEVGGETLKAQADRYALLLREISSTVNQINKNVAIYLPFSGELNKNSDLSSKNYGITELVNAINSASNGTPFGLAIDFLATSDLSSKEIQKLSVFNKSVILIDDGTKDRNQSQMIYDSADFSLIVLKATYGSCGFIKAVLPSVDTDYESTIRYADTDQIVKKLSYLSEMFGDETATYFRLSLEKAPKKLTELSFSLLSDDEIEKAVIYDFGSRSTPSEINSSENCKAVSIVDSLGNEKNVLSAEMTGITSENAGNVIISSVDGVFSSADGICFTARLGSLPSGTEYGILEVIIKSGERVISASGKIDSEFRTYSFELSNVDYIDYIGFFVSGENDIGDPTLLISEIDAYSLSGEIDIGKEETEKKIYIEYIGLAVIALILLIGIEIYRLKRQPNTDNENDIDN